VAEFGQKSNEMHFQPAFNRVIRRVIIEWRAEAVWLKVVMRDGNWLNRSSAINKLKPKVTSLPNG